MRGGLLFPLFHLFIGYLIIVVQASEQGCLQLESLLDVSITAIDDADGVVQQDIILDRSVLGQYTCLESTLIKRLEGNLEIGPSKYLSSIELNGLETIVGSLALIGLGRQSDEDDVTFRASQLLEVNENILIRATNIGYLSLPSLKRVDRSLELADNLRLADLNMDSLKQVGLHVTIRGNARLINISLPMLSTIRWDLVVVANAGLLSIDLPLLQTIGEDFELHWCGSLKNISLPVLNKIGEDLEFYALNDIKAINLPSLIDIGEDLEFDNCPNLQSIGMNQLLRIDEDATFSNLPNLAAMNFNSLVEIGEDFEMIQIARLEKLRLPSLKTIKSDWLLNDVRNLAEIDLPRLTYAEGGVILQGLPKLEIFELPVLEIIGDEKGGGSRQRRLAEDKDQKEEALAAELEVDQRLYITGCDKLTKVDLKRLESISADMVAITRLPNLLSVDFSSLISWTVSTDDEVGYFFITDNVKLDRVLLNENFPKIMKPNLYSFKGNKVPCPALGPKWITKWSSDQISSREAYDIFETANCDPDSEEDWETTLSDFDRQLCIESCPSEARKNVKIFMLGRSRDCVSLSDLYASRSDVIDGSVLIEGSDFTCIECGTIKRINGCVTVVDNPLLKDLRCNALKEIKGAVVIRNNPNLKRLRTNGLGVIGGTGLYVIANGIRSISLPNLASVFAIQVVSNSGLRSLQMDRLVSTDRHFHIFTNPSLVELSVPLLYSIGTNSSDGDLILQGNTAIKQYDFPSLTFVSEDIEMWHSPFLNKLLFPVLQITGEDLEIYQFPSLKKLRLPNLRDVDEDLELWDLAVLRTIDLPKLERVGEDFEIFNNLLLEDTLAPMLKVVEEDVDFYCNREALSFRLPNLTDIGEDVQVFGNDNLLELYFPLLQNLADDEGGGFLITTNRRLTSLSFPSLQRMGKIRDGAPDEDGDLGDGGEAVSLYSMADAGYNQNRPFMLCDNPDMELFNISQVFQLRSGGFWAEGNCAMKLIDMNGLEALGNTSYFVVRENPLLQQDSLWIPNVSQSNYDPILSNLYCNSPKFCVDESTAPSWVEPICPADRSDWCDTNDKTFPHSLCDSPLDCTDAFYLWSRENDYDFEENIIQLFAPPRFSAVQWRRDNRCG